MVWLKAEFECDKCSRRLPALCIVTHGLGIGLGPPIPENREAAIGWVLPRSGDRVDAHVLCPDHAEARHG